MGIPAGAQLLAGFHAYARFAPYQFLAYWFELWRGYERRVGDARGWNAAQHGATFTAVKLR